MLDLRHNIGGNSDLLPPLLRALAQFRNAVPTAPVYVATSRSTFSAAQVFLAQLERLVGVIVAGEPNGSRPTFVSEDTQVVLPYSGLMASIPTRLHQARSLDGRRWIAPQIPVELDSQSYFANGDPVREALMSILSAK